jgi:hypothetical protein
MMGVPDAVPAEYLAALRATGAVHTAALEHAFASSATTVTGTCGFRSPASAPG